MRERHFDPRPVVAVVAEAQPFIVYEPSRLHSGHLIESLQQSDFVVLRSGTRWLPLLRALRTGAAAKRCAPRERGNNCFNVNGSERLT
jgi:hypothetical protein